MRGLLKRMFDYALTCGLIQANPVMALPMRHVYRAAARDRALTPEEIRQFLRAMQTSNIRRQFKIAFQLILMTLVRKSELMLAQWKDVHLDEGEWHIPVENSKTGKPHIVYSYPPAGHCKASVPGHHHVRSNQYGTEPTRIVAAVRRAVTAAGSDGPIVGVKHCSKPL